MSLKVRLLDQSFLRDIHAIEASRFTHPWSEQQIAEEMRHPRIIALGAFHGESLLGYLFAYLLPEELQLNNVAVHKEFSRMGIATLLLEYLEQLGKGEGCREILLEVNERTQAPSLCMRSAASRSRGVAANTTGMAAMRFSCRRSCDCRRESDVITEVSHLVSHLYRGSCRVF